MAKVSNKKIKYICRSNPCESNMLEILFQAVFLFLVCDDVTERDMPNMIISAIQWEDLYSLFWTGRPALRPRKT